VAETVILHAGREIRARETFIRDGDSTWHHTAEMHLGGAWVPTERQVLHRLSV
jgi:hypothetical protein